MRFNFLVLLLLIGLTTVRAQDMSTTQSFAAPLLINPALSGAYQGNFRAAALYRDQWGSILPDALRSFVISGDARIPIGGISKTTDYIGVGVLFYSDKVNPFDYSTNSINFNGAFHKTLGYNSEQYLSGGVQVGLIQKNFSYSEFTFQDQFDGITDFPFLSGEQLPLNNFTYLDVNLGIQYTTTLQGEHTLSAGLAAYHLTQPNQSFYKEVDNTDLPLINDNSLHSRYVMNVFANIKTNDFLSFTPRLIAQVQGDHKKLELGSGMRYLVNDVKSLALHAGLFVRGTHQLDQFSVTDIMAMVGVELESVIIGLSFDLNMTDYGTFNSGQQTIELSFKYSGGEEASGVYCPEF